MKVNKGLRSTSVLRVSDALLVPRLEYTSLSLNVIVAKRNKIAFDQNNCRIDDKNGTTIAVGQRHDKFYILNVQGQEETRTIYDRDGQSSGCAARFMKN